MCKEMADLTDLLCNYWCHNGHTFSIQFNQSDLQYIQKVSISISIYTPWDQTDELCNTNT